MKSIFNGVGYIFADDRSSGGKLTEDDLLGCGHCPKPIPKAKWNNDGGWRCWSCSKPLCEECRKAPPQMICLGTDRDRIERAIDDLHRKEQNAKILGI